MFQKEKLNIVKHYKYFNRQLNILYKYAINETSEINFKKFIRHLY